MALLIDSYLTLLIILSKVCIIIIPNNILIPLNQNEALHLRSSCYIPGLLRRCWTNGRFPQRLPCESFKITPTSNIKTAYWQLRKTRTPAWTRPLWWLAAPHSGITLVPARANPLWIRSERAWQIHVQMRTWQVCLRTQLCVILSGADVDSGEKTAPRAL